MQLLTLVVLLYAESPLVIWSLYTLEQHDIVLYYTSACDTTSGRSFVEAIEDGNRSFNGACYVVKIAETVKSLEVHPFVIVPVEHARSVEFPPYVDRFRAPAPISSVFHPPRVHSLHTK